MPRRRDPYDGQGRPNDLQPLINNFLRLSPQVQFLIIAVLVVGGVIAFLVYQRSQHRQTAGPTSPTQSPTYPTAPGPTTPGPTTPGTYPTAPTPPGSAEQSPHLVLGNPSNATPDPSNRNNYLMVKPYYALSYNDTNGTPNWVSWRVISSDLGNAPRKPLFDPDTLLPQGFKVVVHKDYSGGGFDRGHMCPHSDRAATTDMSYATFVMTNIIPQAPNVNQKAWAQLETYSRDMVRKGQRLYIISGPWGQGGVGSNGPASTVGRGKVVVPASCWKVIVAVPDSGGDDLSNLTPASRVIAVDMPNDNTQVGEAWAGFRVSPAAIEAKTGYRFFDRLNPAVADGLRQKVDDTRIPPPRPMTHSGD